MKIRKILAILAAIFVAGTVANFAGTTERTDGEGAVVPSENHVPVEVGGAVADKSVRVPSESVPANAVPAEVARPGDLATQGVPANRPTTNREQVLADFARWQAGEGEDAVVNLAQFYATWQNPEKNLDKARELLEQEIAAGNPRAMYVLAMHNEFRTPRERQIELLRAAAEAGFAPACVEYANFAFAKNWQTRTWPDEHKTWLLKGAEAGDFKAQMQLARGFLHGINACPRDDSQAFFWFQKAAETGDKNALFELGKCYANGIGVEKNLDEARKILRRALVLDSWRAWDLLKQLPAGTQDFSMPREVFGFVLGEKKAVPAPDEVDFAGTRWKISVRANRRGNVDYIHIHHRSSPRDFAREREIYEKTRAELLEKYGKFLQEPPRERDVLLSLHDKFNDDWKQETRFFDGRMDVVLSFTSFGVSVFFDLRSEKWENQYKHYTFVPAKSPEVWRAEGNKLRDLRDKILALETDLDEIVDFCVEHVGCKHDAQKYLTLEVALKNEALYWANSAEEKAKIIASLAKKYVNDADFEALKREYLAWINRTDYVEVAENRELLRERELVFARYRYADSVRGFFKRNPRLARFIQDLMRDHGNDPAKMLELYEQSGLRAIFGRKLSEEIRASLALRYKENPGRKSPSEAFSRNHRILREVIQFENARERENAGMEK